MNTLRAISDVLLIAGGLNWGSIAVTNGNLNPVERIVGGNEVAKNVIYGAVGAAAVYTIYDNVKNGFPRSDRRDEMVSAGKRY